MTNGSIATWAFHTLIDVNLTCLTFKEKKRQSEYYIPHAASKIDTDKALLNRTGTLPSFGADTGKALVVFSLFTHSSIFTGSGAAGCK